MTDALDVSVPVVVLKSVQDLVQHGGLGVSRSLGRLGVPVYWLYGDTRAPGPRSRFVRGVLPWDANGDDSVAVERLLALAGELPERPVLVPIDDRSSVLVADNLDAISEVFRVPQPEPDAVRRLASKHELHTLCTRLGLPAPQASFPQHRADALEAIGAASFPLVLKRIEGSLQAARAGAPSVVIAANEAEAVEAYDELESPIEPNVMLQEYVPGGPESVWIFNGYFSASGECLARFTGRKLRQWPPYTGSATLGVCEPNAEVERLTLALVAEVGYRGILDIGFRYDERDGGYKLLDANPRIGGSFRLFVGDGGLDVARALYLDLTGRPVPASGLRAGRRWLVEPLDVLSSLRYARDGRLTVRQWARSFRGVEEGAWFARDDPLPSLLCLRGYLVKGVSQGIRPKTAEHEATQRRTDVYFAQEAAFWDEIYRRDDVYSLVHRERRERALRWARSLELGPEARALDAGCGAGHAAAALADAGVSVEAVDPVEEMVERARANTQAAGVGERVHVRVGDVHRLPFEDESFSLALALGVLPWVHSPADAVHELARVLEPGGHLIVSVDNRRRLTDLVDPRRTPLLGPARPALKRVLRFPSPNGAGAPSALHTRAELRDLLAAAGLEVEAEETIGFGPFTLLGRRVLDGRPGARLHARLQALADRGAVGLRAGGAQVLVLARRPPAQAS